MIDFDDKEISKITPIPFDSNKKECLEDLPEEVVQKIGDTHVTANFAIKPDELVNYLDYLTNNKIKNMKDAISLKELTITLRDDGSNMVDLDFVPEKIKFERIRRITGYLVGSIDRWNNAKRAEEHDRVKHIGQKKSLKKEVNNNTSQNNNSLKPTMIPANNAEEAFAYFTNLFENQSDFYDSKKMRVDDDKVCIEATATVMDSPFKPSKTKMMQIIQELAPKASSYPPGDYAISIMKKVNETYPEILREREASEETALKR